jgi:hypothetical protein
MEVPRARLAIRLQVVVLDAPRPATIGKWFASARIGRTKIDEVVCKPPVGIGGPRVAHRASRRGSVDAVLLKIRNKWIEI